MSYPRACTPWNIAALPARASIGVLSDTHGYLDPAVLDHFASVTHIIHAGDILDERIIAELERVAPLTAVAGNLDVGALACLPREASGTVAGVRFAVAHKAKRLLKLLAVGALDSGPRPTPPDLLVWGHTHVPSATWVDGALHLNPGSASAPDEDDDGPTIAIVEIEPAGLGVRFVPLRRGPALRTEAIAGRAVASGS